MTNAFRCYFCQTPYGVEKIGTQCEVCGGAAYEGVIDGILDSVSEPAPAGTIEDPTPAIGSDPTR